MTARVYRWMPLLFLAPSLILLGLFVFYPTVNAAWTSLTNWNGISPSSDFTGLRNYLDLFTDGDFLRSLRNTCLYVVLTLPTSLVLAIGAALLIQRGSAGSTVLRLAFTVPFVVSIPVVSVVWVWILDPNFGILNYGLHLVGLGRQDWLGNPSTSMLGIAIPSVWRQFGYFMLIVLAGIKGIDPSYHEAAALDGASYWRRLRRITLPLLGPQLFFCLVLGVIDSFQVFSQVDLMTGGGPLNSTNVVVYELYKQGFSYFHVGYACAMAVVLMLVLGALTYVQQRWVGSKVFYQ
ncbi:sugar ABC transporter permease [Rugosimonospora acidiphila]|uniref:Sugar ABC transporter permease n=1 Tax=Rugosimonospora acidiphila TaxID=556531 RepID=A0ABP9SEJ0_9ACTN